MVIYTQVLSADRQRAIGTYLYAFLFRRGKLTTAKKSSICDIIYGKAQVRRSDAGNNEHANDHTDLTSN